MKRILRLFMVYGPIRFFSFAYSEFLAIVWGRMIRNTYSQDGEDLIIDKLLGYKKKGLYVDIGAFDPFRFSNTMRFYKRGWSGINIEPDREHWKNFVRARKDDTNLNIGIGKNKTDLTFYEFDPPTLSTFSKTFSQDYVEQGFSLRDKKIIPVYTLRDVLKKYTSRKKIDFLSVDVEGYEYEVLSSNDWKKYRPTLLCIELSFSPKDSIEEKKRKNVLMEYIKYQKYSLIQSTPNNSVFMRS